MMICVLPWSICCSLRLIRWSSSILATVCNFSFLLMIENLNSMVLRLPMMIVYIGFVTLELRSSDFFYTTLSADRYCVDVWDWFWILQFTWILRYWFWLGSIPLFPRFWLGRYGLMFIWLRSITVLNLNCSFLWLGYHIKYGQLLTASNWFCLMLCT